MKGRFGQITLASIALLTATSAFAAQENTYFSPEISYQQGEEFDLDSGFGLGANYGIDMTDYTSIEGSLDYSTIAYSGAANFGDYERVRLGVRGLIFPFTRNHKVAPFISAGGFGHYIDAFNDDLTGGSVSSGLGLLMKGTDNADLRLEARYNVDFIEAEGAVLENQISGWQVGLGVNYRLGQTKTVAAPAPKPVTRLAPPVAKPTCGGIIKDGMCINDSDRDGIYDNADRCPGTPAGVEVTANGCPIDRDGDGIAAYLDKCPNTMAGLSVDGKGCAAQGQSLPLRDVEFELNSSVLTAAARGKLVRVADAMKGQPTMRVRLEGHTDSTGSDSYNLGLSKKRARSVYSFLTGAGISANRLESEGYGETRPVASNATKAGRLQNRRVEFKIIGQ